jgi:hypothetical protein
MDSGNYGTEYRKMTDWLKVEDDRKKLVYEQVAANQGLPPIAIEKGFWVTLVLESVFGIKQAENMVFKGGTSLSKGWNLIQRFSEDVDLAVDRKAFGFDGKLGSSKRTRLRKAIREFVLEELTPELKNILKEKGADVEVKVWESKNSDEDPSTIEVKFPTVTESVKYLPPRVLVEINARSLIEPNEEKELTPFSNTAHFYFLSKMVNPSVFVLKHLNAVLSQGFRDQTGIRPVIVVAQNGIGSIRGINITEGLCTGFNEICAG